MHAGSAGRWPNVLVRTGIPARQIVDTIKQVRADILAVGPPRRRALRETLEGTIAAKTLREPKCPLLIVRQEPRAAYRNVLLALDLSAISGGALRAAESLVLAADTQARIVHAYEPPYQGMLHYADVGMASAAAYGRGGKREADDGGSRSDQVSERGLHPLRDRDRGGSACRGHSTRSRALRA